MAEETQEGGGALSPGGGLEKHNTHTHIYLHTHFTGFLNVNGDEGEAGGLTRLNES